jgi:predicted DNA binding CopG/RHH family protein
MKSTKEFPFDKARRISAKELKAYKYAFKRKAGKFPQKRKGRPPKSKDKKYVPISVRLDPRALAWLKKQAKLKALPYQTIINQLILQKVA